MPPKKPEKGAKGGGSTKGGGGGKSGGESKGYKAMDGYFLFIYICQNLNFCIYRFSLQNCIDVFFILN